MKRVKRNIVLLTIILSLIFTTSLTTFSNSIYLSPEINTIISKWLTRNVIQGYPDGALKLTEPMTRAEFATVLCQIFGFSDTPNAVVLSDVPDEKWYSSSIQKVLSKGLMDFDSFNSSYVFHPTSFITYQQAMGSLSKAYKLTLLDGQKVKTSPPDKLLTRLDCLMLLDKTTKELIHNACLYTSDVAGNLIINTSDVTLKNMTIDGNLYLTEGIGTGRITLDNVRVKGVVHVNGCGENSLLIRNKSSINSMLVENKISAVRISADSKDAILKLALLTPTILDGPISVSDTESNKYAIYPTHDTPYSPLNNTSSDTNPLTPNIPPVEDDDHPPVVVDPPIEDDDDPPVVVDPPIEDDDDPPTTTGSVINLEKPSNICIDFASYPCLTVSWDEVPLASSYTFNMTNSQDTTHVSSLQTTSSSISLDTSCCPIIPNNEYAISITAVLGNDSSSTTETFKIPSLSLHELNNGTLSVVASENLTNKIMIKNFNLSIYRENTNSNGIPHYILENAFTLKHNITSYDIPITLINDVTYSLKILNTSIPAGDEPLISSYTAHYFANLSYLQATSSPCIIGSTEANPITLTSARHLRNLSTFVNAGQSTVGKYFKLLNDINFENPIFSNISQATSNFTPIGILVDEQAIKNDKASLQNKPFSGDFDGGNHCLSNLKIDATTHVDLPSYSMKCLGLFAYTSGNIKNITLDNSCKILSTSPYTVSAGIVAYADYRHSSKTISGCYNYGSIQGFSYTSGIVGIIYTGPNASCKVENCYNYGGITSSTNSSGIVSLLNLSASSCIDVNSCYNYGNIKADAFAGGIIGESQGGTSTIKSCFNFGNVSARKQANAAYRVCSGGILASGVNSGLKINRINISNCLNGGMITSYCDTTSNCPAKSVYVYAGGIIGRLTYLASDFSYNYNYGTASSTVSRASKGTTCSGPILATPASCSNIAYCYTISYTTPVPATQNNIFNLSYTEFIDKIKDNLPDVSNDVETSILGSLGGNSGT